MPTIEPDPDAIVMVEDGRAGTQTIIGDAPNPPLDPPITYQIVSGISSSAPSSARFMTQQVALDSGFQLEAINPEDSTHH